MANFERPSRSDARLSNEEASKIEGETRDYFDGIAPQRHAKPQRSEYSAKYNDAQFDGHENDVIPEYLEFQHLEKDDPQVSSWSLDYASFLCCSYKFTDQEVDLCYRNWCTREVQYLRSLWRQSTTRISVGLTSSTTL